MTDEVWTRQWTIKMPGALRILSVLFIAVSVIFARTAIFARFGNTIGYLYCVVGIFLIMALGVSISVTFAGKTPANAQAPLRPPPQG